MCHKPTDVGDVTIVRAVLELILASHPTTFTEDDLIREMVDQPDDVAEANAIRQATRDLARAGLLHRNGGLIFPTRTALYVDKLWGEAT